MCVAGTECSGGDARWSVIWVCVSDGTRGASGLEAGYQSGLSVSLAGQGWFWVGSGSEKRTVDQICKNPEQPLFTTLTVCGYRCGGVSFRLSDGGDQRVGPKTWAVEADRGYFYGFSRLSFCCLRGATTATKGRKVCDDVDSSARQG